MQVGQVDNGEGHGGSPLIFMGLEALGGYGGQGGRATVSRKTTVDGCRLLVLLLRPLRRKGRLRTGLAPTGNPHLGLYNGEEGNCTGRTTSTT